MKKINFIISALIVILLIGCATSTYSLKPYCQGETARFLRNNLDPGSIKIEDISSENYADEKIWYFWTAVTPNGSKYRCQAFTGDKTCYCTKRMIDDSEKKAKGSQKSRKMTS